MLEKNQNQWKSLMPKESPPEVTLPETCRIGYKTYTLEPMAAQDKGKNIGWHYPQKHLIQLEFDDLNQVELVNTYLHEVFHAFFSLIPDLFDEKKEEEVVGYLGNAMTQFLRDNPDTIKWMLKALNAKQL
jgi:hypothetical protein